MAAETTARKVQTSLWLAGLLVAGLAAVRTVSVSGDQLAARFDILYETPNLRTVELIRAGRNVYSPQVYAEPPFWITVYTPLYHHVVARLPADPDNPYFTGRLVGLCCTLAAAACIALCGRASPGAALLFMGAFFLVRPVTQNAALLKNDTLGLACSALAVLCAARAPQRRAWILPASLAALLALSSKQSFLAAPLSCGAFLLLRERRAGLAFLTLTGLLALLALGLARLAWGPGFFFSVAEALRNPLTWQQFSEQWAAMLRQPVFVGLLLLFGAGLSAQLWRERLAALRGSPLALYALASLALLVATVGKLGSNTNYFIEPALAIAMWLAASARAQRAGAWRSLARAAGAALLAAAALLEVRLAEPPDYSVAGHPAKERFHAALEDLAGRMRAQGPPQPRVLNLAFAGLAWPLPGEILISDPFLYFLLWEQGKLPRKPVAELLRRREVDGVLAPVGLRPGPGPMPHPGIFQALFAGYRPVARFPGFEYWARGD